MSHIQSAEYLGDSVYIHVDNDGVHVVMTTDSHLPKNAQNIIYLDPMVERRLLMYLQARLK